MLWLAITAGLAAWYLCYRHKRIMDAENLQNEMFDRYFWMKADSEMTLEDWERYLPVFEYFDDVVRRDSNDRYVRVSESLKKTISKLQVRYR